MNPTQMGQPQDLTNQADTASVARDEPAGSLEARLLRRLLRSLGDPPIEFLLAWSGERIAPPAMRLIGQVRISNRSTLLGILADPQVRFGDAYSDRRVEISGDLIQFMRSVYRA